MKLGRDISSLAEEITRQNKSKRDFIVPTPRLYMTDDLMLEVDNKEGFGINDIAHDHIAAWTPIAKPYYEHMKVNAPSLLSENVNYWFIKLVMLQNHYHLMVKLKWE